LAVKAAVYILNRLGTDANKGETPFQRWHKEVPDLSHMKVFGCEAFVHEEKYKQKLDHRAWKGIFVGYDRQNGTYIIWDAKTKRVHVSRSVTFNESKFTCSTTNTAIRESGGNKYIDIEIQPQRETDPTLVTEDQSTPTEGTQMDTHMSDHNQNESDSDSDSEIEYDLHNPRSIAQLRSNFGGGLHWSTPNQQEKTTKGRPARSCNSVFSKKAMVALATEIIEQDEPQSYEAAMNSPFAQEWKVAMKNEIDSLTKMGTWELVEKPTDRNTIKGKWVFKIKRNDDGSTKKFKARFVAKGFSQTLGVDYWDTFAPVAKMSTLRTVLAVAVQQNWHLEHSDVSNAYVNSSFEEDGEGEEIFLEQPQGLEIKGRHGEHLVCKLKKGLYGLKQSGRMWNKNIHKKLLDLGFTQSLADTCLYTKRVQDKIIVIVLFVDDMVIAGDNDMIQEFKKQISKKNRNDT
jgi:hypothetical protein